MVRGVISPTAEMPRSSSSSDSKSVPEFGMEFGEAGGAQQFAGGVVVALLQRAAEFQRGLALAFAGGLGHGQQSVGDFGHGADHDYGILRETAFDDGGDAVDGFGVFDGGAAELHDDHGRVLPWWRPGRVGTREILRSA